MQRFAAVWHASPQKMVGILFALLLAAMMAVGSGANFNSQSANPGNVVTAGVLDHINGAEDAAFLTVSTIKPDETKSGSVTMQNTGDIDGIFSVEGEIVSDSTAAAPTSQPFADVLNLKVTNRDTGEVLYDDLMSNLDAAGPQGSSTIAPGDTNTFDFDVTFNDGGPDGADNVYQAAQVEADFTWEAVSN